MSDRPELPSSFASFYLAEIRRVTARKAEALERAAAYAAAIHGVDNVQRLDFPCGDSAYAAGDHDLTRHAHHCPLCSPHLRADGCDLVYYLPDL